MINYYSPWVGAGDNVENYIKKKTKTLLQSNTQSLYNDDNMSLVHLYVFNCLFVYYTIFLSAIPPLLASLQLLDLSRLMAVCHRRNVCKNHLMSLYVSVSNLHPSLCLLTFHYS